MEQNYSRREPWRKRHIIQRIAVFDIVLATVSIFYNGKTFLVIFDGLHQNGQEQNWPFIFFVLSITFGIQILHILLALLLFRASKQPPRSSYNDSSHLSIPIRNTRIWQIASVIFLFLLIVEFCVGLRTFEYNEYIFLFITFVVLKFGWRVFTIVYVQKFRQDLEVGLRNLIQRASAEPPVFRMILTSPENGDVDVSDNEVDQKSDLEDDAVPDPN